MFSSRRPGKRSIVGTRVCAPQGDGLYAPALIRSVAGPAGRHQRYSVRLDSGVLVEALSDRDLIGPGFQVRS